LVNFPILPLASLSCSTLPAASYQAHIPPALFSMSSPSIPNSLAHGLSPEPLGQPASVFVTLILMANPNTSATSCRAFVIATAHSSSNADSLSQIMAQGKIAQISVSLTKKVNFSLPLHKLAKV
jgi:hypothetical protein